MTYYDEVRGEAQQQGPGHDPRNTARQARTLQRGDEVTVVEDDGPLRIVRVPDAETKGQRLVRHMRGRGTAKETHGMSTDELMELLHGE